MRRSAAVRDGPRILRVAANLPGPAERARFRRQLRSPTWRSAVRALVDGAFVVVTLETRGARPLFASPAPLGARADAAEAVQVATAVDAALGILPVSPSCLRRSITLLRELHRLRLAATLHIGVRKVGDRFEAHAWVQTGDVVINDDPHVTGGYVELASGDVEGLFPLLH
jgi:hypothetical protein